MAIIKTVLPEDATGEVAEIYKQAKNAIGFIPNSFILLSANPLILRQQWEYIGSMFQHKTINNELTAAIRMLVSQTTGCDYCIDMNAGMLIKKFSWTIEQVKAARDNYLNSPFQDKDKALLGLVLKAVKNSNSVNAEDIASVRKHGWSDGDIFDVVTYGAKMVSTDILINTFKVEHE
jgi:uncharacterized peroxidase-related enzyme